MEEGFCKHGSPEMIFVSPVYWLRMMKNRVTLPPMHYSAIYAVRKYYIVRQKSGARFQLRRGNTERVRVWKNGSIFYFVSEVEFIHLI